MNRSPFLFDEFFASEKEESISPFLIPSSRKWGKNLSLRAASFSALFLALSFFTVHWEPPLAYLLLSIVYFLSGTPALIGSIEDLKNLTINIDILMTLAALLSVLIGSGMEGALLLVLFELSAALEEAVTAKTKSTFISLNQLTPKLGHVVEPDGKIIARSIHEIAVGTNLLVKAGELVPLDGKVKEGSSFVNLVHLTGESRPIPKFAGTEVPAGAKNLDGSLVIEVTRTSRDSTLARIIQLILCAQEAKPVLQRFLDRFGKWYASIVILLASFFALLLPFVFSIPYLGEEGAIYRALTFLIAASPCALILATPTAYLSAISSCAKRGLLLKGGAILDALSRCTIAAFDKTGTLTTGKLTCTSFRSLDQAAVCPKSTALAIAASIEQHTVHPIAEAIAHYAEKNEAPRVEIKNFKALAGFGLQGEVESQGNRWPILIGHYGFIAPHLSSPQLEQLQENLAKEGELSCLLLIEKSLFVFHFQDTLRPEAKETIALLKKREKLELMILSGDLSINAQRVAMETGIDLVFAELSPEDKLEKVSEYAKKGGLIMIGDGVNDAPALARATVGISLGKIASATAVDASDVVLLNDDLLLIPWLLKKAQKTRRILKQNLALALFVILFATTPALLGAVPLWLAVLLHEGGTVLVGLNSLRLLKK